MRFRRRSWRVARPCVPHCRRRAVPRRLKAVIVVRQGERCADCGTLLVAGLMVFDHRPPLALRDVAADPNDPDLLAAICRPCNTSKTARDLRAIAHAKRCRPLGTTGPSAAIAAALNHIQPLVAARDGRDGADGTDLTDRESIDIQSRETISCRSDPLARLGATPESVQSTLTIAEAAKKSPEQQPLLHAQRSTPSLWDRVIAGTAALFGKGGLSRAREG
jgi:5-methylcytosine-specific restriction endonuclease McrA